MKLLAPLSVLSLALVITLNGNAQVVQGPPQLISFGGTSQPVTCTGGCSSPVKPTTPTQSSVNDSNVNQTCLPSNSNRLGATIFNESTAILYLKLGATASATSYTLQMNVGGYYEVPFGYTGIIDCIWSADTAGAARITEFTP